MENLDYAYTEPVREFARRRGISPTKVYEWINSGQIESFLEGKRRHVVVASYDRLVRRRVAEQGTIKLPSSNPKARVRQRTAPEVGSQDLWDQQRDDSIVSRHRDPRPSVR